MSEKVLLFYSSVLPHGSAGATRVVALALIIKKLGYEPYMLGIGGKAGDDTLQGMYKGIRYELIPVPKIKSSGLTKAIQRQRALNEQICQWLNTFKQENKIKAVIVTEMQDYERTFRKYCRKNRLPLALNVVEWYGLSDFTKYHGSMAGAVIRYFKAQWNMRYAYKKCKNIIAISSYLQRHFEKSGCNTVRIPTITDVSEYPFLTDTVPDKLKIGYAGTPWGKDHIDTVMEAIAKLPLEMQKKIKFTIYGASEDDVCSKMKLSPEALALIGNCICCGGVIPQNEIKEKIVQNDFTILIREPNRKNSAGFPTKVGESMAAGVPVIANLTSDIGEYLHNGTEGVVCSDYTVDACVEALYNALHQKQCGNMRALRSNARCQAEKSFEFSKYTEAMNAFFNRMGDNS